MGWFVNYEFSGGYKGNWGSEIKMFPGMFMRKPNKSAMFRQLKSHVAMFGVWVVVIRLTMYILRYFSDHNNELKLER